MQAETLPPVPLLPLILISRTSVGAPPQAAGEAGPPSRSGSFRTRQRAYLPGRRNGKAGRPKGGRESSDADATAEALRAARVPGAGAGGTAVLR